MKAYIEDEIIIELKENRLESAWINCYLVPVEGYKHWCSFDYDDDCNLDQWINTYVNYNPFSGEVVIRSIFQDDDNQLNDEEYTPNEEERVYLMQLLENECQKQCGRSCKEVCAEWYKEEEECKQ